MKTLFADDAHRLATTRDDVALIEARQRRAGVADTLALLCAGKPGRAHLRMWQLLLEQAKTQGLYNQPSRRAAPPVLGGPRHRRWVA